jgi:hypothetical protein
MLFCNFIDRLGPGSDEAKRNVSPLLCSTRATFSILQTVKHPNRREISHKVPKFFFSLYDPCISGDKLNPTQVEGLILAEQHLSGYDTSHELFKVCTSHTSSHYCLLLSELSKSFEGTFAKCLL